MEINRLIKIVENKLKKNFKISNLIIEDKSFLHSKHKNFKKGKFHIKLTIESQELKKISVIDSNKKIYNVLKNEMSFEIHSLQIKIV